MIIVNSRMRDRAAFLSLLFAVSIGCFAPSLGLAASDQVGLAVTVRNSVSEVEPKASKIMAGDDVIRDEVVQTQDDSGAKFVLKDSTNLVLGPNSRLKLDRTVFSDEKGLGEVVIKLALGSFRFITGQSPKESYAITTPIATIGVRGTTLDFFVQPTQNYVKLVDGQSRVCAGSSCVELLRKGDSAVVDINGVRLQDIAWSFDSECNGMCSPMSFAEAQNGLTTGSVGGGPGGGGGINSPPPIGGVNSGTFGLGFTSTPNGSSNFLTGGAGLGGGGFSQISNH